MGGGGALVSQRVVLSAYHCANHRDSTSIKECDHSDGKRVAKLGMHNDQIDWKDGDQEQTIPIIEVHYPPNPWYRQNEDYTHHDFVLFRLASNARYTSKVSPICLPAPNSEYGGESATAAGWG